MNGFAMDVSTWMEETGRGAPMALEVLRRLERQEYVVDLETGAVFGQADDWWDFAQRWAEYRRQFGLAVDVEDLEAAIYRAQGAPDGKMLAFVVCREMAARVFSRMVGWEGSDGADQARCCGQATGATCGP